MRDRAKDPQAQIECSDCHPQELEEEVYEADQNLIDEYEEDELEDESIVESNENFYGVSLE